MNFAYHFFRSIRCRVPAPSVGFGEGGRLGAPAVLWGRGRKGDETRRSRKTAPAALLPPNAEFRMQNAENRHSHSASDFLHSAFCILHSASGGHPCLR